MRPPTGFYARTRDPKTGKPLPDDDSRRAAWGRYLSDPLAAFGRELGYRAYEARAAGWSVDDIADLSGKSRADIVRGMNAWTDAEREARVTTTRGRR